LLGEKFEVNSGPSHAAVKQTFVHDFALSRIHIDQKNGTLRPEDIDPKWPRDHWLDALAYGVRDLWTNKVGSGRTIGMY